MLKARRIWTAVSGTIVGSSIPQNMNSDASSVYQHSYTPRAAPLAPTLAGYLRSFSGNSGIASNLNVSPDLANRVFEPLTGMQLLRIIQEALTNGRKHARAHHVDVRIAVRDSRAEATVQDDGAGFDSALVQTAGSQKFGLRVMRERAEEVGAAVEVHSAPGEATRVVISVPLGKRLS